MRNKLDFVPSGQVAGQIAEVDVLERRQHTSYRQSTDDKGDWDGDVVEYTYTLPGVEVGIRLWGHPFVYRVRAINGERGPQVVELHIDQPQHQPDVPLTPDDLRKLARYLDRLAYAAIDGLAIMESARRFHEPEKPRRKRPGARGHGQDFYAEIAEFAKLAHKERHIAGSVRQRIAKHYTVTEHTADKYLARARKMGFLKPGELGGKQPSSTRKAR